MKKSIKKALLITSLCVTATLSTLTAVANTKIGMKNSALLSQKEMQSETSMQFDAVAAAVLRQGSKGGEVKEVQRRLKAWG